MSQPPSSDRPESHPPESTPPGYQPGDYVPYADRTPDNPSAVAGEPGWGDPAAAGAPADPYRAVYGYDSPDRVHYAGWWTRVGAYLVDMLFTYAAMIPLFVGYVLLLREATTTVDAFGNQTTEFAEVPPAAIGLIVLGAVTGIAFWIWNTCLRQGRTGYSLGKSVLGIRLVGTQSRTPIGGGMSFVRQIAHILDGLCYIGYLWPIWDKEKQTFADKIVGTHVIRQAAPERA